MAAHLDRPKEGRDAIQGIFESEDPPYTSFRAALNSYTYQNLVQLSPSLSWDCIQNVDGVAITTECSSKNLSSPFTVRRRRNALESIRIIDMMNLDPLCMMRSTSTVEIVSNFRLGRDRLTENLENKH